jgi:hypothetical protein
VDPSEAGWCLVGCGLSKEGDFLTPKQEDFNHDVKLDVDARLRQGVKAVLEEVLQEEMTQHLEAGYREHTPTRQGERNGHLQRNLLSQTTRERPEECKKGVRGCCRPALALPARWSAFTLLLRRRGERLVRRRVRHRAQAG